MRNQTVTFEQVIVTETCINCGVLFGIPEEMQQRLRNNHNYFYCPNGHAQHYTGKSEADKVREALERERKEREKIEQQLKGWKNYAELAAADRDEAKEKLRVTRGQLTKTKKRVAASVCPCCNRSFPNDKLHKHIATKHPDFAESENP